MTNHRRRTQLDLVASLALAVSGCVNTVEPPAPSTSPATTHPPRSTSSTTLVPSTTAVVSSTPPTPSTTELFVDVDPPPLEIADPAHGSTVPTESYRFRGTTESGVTLQAAGRYDIGVEDDGSWEVVLVLRAGANTATFAATDSAGNETIVHVAVTYCPPIPDVTAMDPAQVTMTPSCGPVVTHVFFKGEGFTDPFWEKDFQSEDPLSSNVWLYAGDGSLYDDCELFADLSALSLQWSPEGHVEGSFVVGAEGGCRQIGTRRPVIFGLYSFSLGCVICDVGAFTVTES